MDQRGMLLIRADASARIGMGHVMRCLALAQEWADRGGRAVFAGVWAVPGLEERIRGEGFEFAALKAVYPEKTDLEGVLALLGERGTRGGFVVLDGYGFGPDYQEGLCRAGYRLLVLDDLNHLPRYEADVILNQGSNPLDYRCRAETVILAGTRYRLLRREFLRARPRPRVPGPGRRVLVLFGGADSRNATLSVLEALDRVLGPEHEVRVAVGPANRHGSELERMAGRAGFVCELLRNAADMPGLLAWADMIVTAGGGASREAAALGAPLVLLPVAENQLPNVRELCAAGAGVSPGGPESLSGAGFADMVRDILEDGDRRAAMSEAGLRLVDGKGPERVIGLLDALSGRPWAEFNLRPVESGDMDQLFRLANDPDVRGNSFSPDPISYADHIRWFRDKLASPDSALFVLDCHGVVAAQVRYDRTEPDAAEVDFSVHAGFRGLGLGVRILAESAGEAFYALGVSRLFGVVFVGNAASRRCFEKAGFRYKGEVGISPRPCVLFEREQERATMEAGL